MTDMTAAERITQWREKNPDTRLTTAILLDLLDTTNLRGADLRSADLWSADLWSADLRGADLWGADLRFANLWSADLRGANLRGALWEGLIILGMPSGEAIFTPTPGGWTLRVGCWSGTIESLRTLISSDEDWPEARGDETSRRRPYLEATIALCEAHTTANPDLITTLATKWGTP
jgi:Pentapeptide repeats (8 copies)